MTRDYRTDIEALPDAERYDILPIGKRASDLGIVAGDEFIVVYASGNKYIIPGDIVVLLRDDGTPSPPFKRKEDRGGDFFITLSRLARTKKNEGQFLNK